MKRTGILALGAAALLTVGCAEPEPSLLITGHIPLTGSGTEDDLTCERPADFEDAEFVFNSVFVNLADPEVEAAGFSIGLLIENRLVDSSTYSPSGYDKNQRLNQNHIEIQSYEVTFDDSGFDTLGDGGDLAYPSSGIVTTDGSLWAELQLFRPSERDSWDDARAIAAGDASATAIVPTFAEIQVIGETVGGTKVRSNILTMPFQVCNGCSEASTPICVAE